MNSELAKAQKHAKRFQDLLAFEKKTENIAGTHDKPHTISHHEQTATKNSILWRGDGSLSTKVIH